MKEGYKKGLDNTVRAGAILGTIFATSAEAQQSFGTPSRSYGTNQQNGNGFGNVGGGFGGGRSGFGNPNRPPMRQPGFSWDAVAQEFFNEVARGVARRVPNIFFNGQNYRRNDRDGSYRNGAGMILNDSAFYESASRRIHSETITRERDYVGRMYVPHYAPVEAPVVEKEIPCVDKEVSSTETRELAFNIKAPLSKPITKFGEHPFDTNRRSALARADEFMDDLIASGILPSEVDKQAFRAETKGTFKDLQDSTYELVQIKNLVYLFIEDSGDGLVNANIKLTKEAGVEKIQVTWMQGEDEYTAFIDRPDDCNNFALAKIVVKKKVSKAVRVCPTDTENYRTGNVDVNIKTNIQGPIPNIENRNQPQLGDAADAALMGNLTPKQFRDKYKNVTKEQNKQIFAILTWLNVHTGKEAEEAKNAVVTREEYNEGSITLIDAIRRAYAVKK